MSYHPRPALWLCLALPACTPETGGDTGDASSTTTTGAGTSTGTPTTGATGDTGDSSDGGTTAEPLMPLPPLADPVPLTDTQLRVPAHVRDEERVLDPRIPADVVQALADGYGDITLGPGEPVLPRTLDAMPAPAPGAAPRLLVRFVHLADTQLSDDESPARLASYDEAADGAFRPQEGHLCRMLNAAVRTINRVHVDSPLDFVLLGGDNTDNAQGNELEWFMSILDGAPRVECDSAVDDDIVPGPENDPKDPFGPVALDVPWRWVTGNHDLLRQGTWPTLPYLGEPIGVSAMGGTRDYGMPGSPIVTGTVIADPARAFVTEADQLMRIASAGDGHGITAEALELGRAFYTFDVEGTPLRIFVISTAAATGASKGLIRQADIDAIIEPTLQAAAADERLVIVTSHHRAGSLSVGKEFGVGEAFADALTGDEWTAYLGSHDHVILHLAAHSHTMHVEPKQPLGGHAHWEVASPALADFPHQLRMLEIWDQDNGGLAIRAIAFDFATTDDPIAEAGRTLGVMDFTSAWEGDGRGDSPADRNVELFIATP
jgi:hypothetical protein